MWNQLEEFQIFLTLSFFPWKKLSIFLKNQLNHFLPQERNPKVKTRWYEVEHSDHNIEEKM